MKVSEYVQVFKGEVLTPSSLATAFTNYVALEPPPSPGVL